MGHMALKGFSFQIMNGLSLPCLIDLIENTRRFHINLNHNRNDVLLSTVIDILIFVLKRTKNGMGDRSLDVA